MKILAISKDNPGIINDDFKPHLKGEAAYVFGLYQNNTIREIYFEKDGDAAILILECEDAEEAKNPGKAASGHGWLNLFYHHPTHPIYGLCQVI